MVGSRGERGATIRQFGVGTKKKRIRATTTFVGNCLNSQRLLAIERIAQNGKEEGSKEAHKEGKG